MPPTRHSCENVRCSRPDLRRTRAVTPHTAHLSRHGSAPLRFGRNRIVSPLLAAGIPHESERPDGVSGPTPPSHVVTRRPDTHPEQPTTSLPATMNLPPKSAITPRSSSTVCTGPSETTPKFNPAIGGEPSNPCPGRAPVRNHRDNHASPCPTVEAMRIAQSPAEPPHRPICAAGAYQAVDFANLMTFIAETITARPECLQLENSSHLVKPSFGTVLWTA